MELLNGPEFKEMRNVCQDTMKTFGMLFLTCAQSELFADAIESHRNRLASSLKAPTVQFPLRPSREIAPSRLSSSIPPHIHDDNHTYEQDPGSKITASIIGWREIQALTHYGVRPQTSNSCWSMPFTLLWRTNQPYKTKNPAIWVVYPRLCLLRKTVARLRPPFGRKV
jgi:hypothetical protein